MNKLIISVLLTIVSILNGYCQMATIQAEVTRPYAHDTANYIRFTINGHSFGERDTIIGVRINPNGFDSCEAVIAHDTLHFLTKFKPGGLYEIKQGCCCAAFTLQARKDPKRGMVIYRNVTKRKVVLVIAEANADTVKAGKTHMTFAHGSAMCLFKPCSILLTETAYLSDKYNYGIENRDYDKLWQEQAKYILAKTWFHFLHGEKIEVEYVEKTRSVKLKLTGYLTEDEHKKEMGF